MFITEETVWRDRFLCLALLYSTFSKDPSTKVGCVLADYMHRPLGFGTNGFSRNSPDSDELFKNREEKYKRVLHAEENAIYNATKSLETANPIAYMTHPPCLHCCHVLSQNFVTNVVAIKPTGEFASRWNLKETEKELDELGIGFELVEKPSNDALLKAISQFHKIVEGC